MAHHESPLTEPSAWEQAYVRFETEAQEVAKFRKRLLRVGAAAWSRNVRIVELFCGRGNGLVALSDLGFAQLEGADLSAALLSRYRGQALLHHCDCRCLPFENDSRDVLIVQGGLHHLLSLPEDLAATVCEVRRVLCPGGRFVVIEPWQTAFLSCVHWLAFQPLARRGWSKFDALATMIEHERATYEAWLAQPKQILDILGRHFTAEQRHIGWGKLTYVGIKSADLPAASST